MSYDIAIIRPDIPDDVALKVACDWQDRDSEYVDTVGTSCQPTYNYSGFFTAFHVRPTTDMDGKSAFEVMGMVDEALKEIGKHSVHELEQNIGSVKPTLTYERGALIREEVQTFSLWPLLLNGYRYSKARGVHVQHQCSGCGS